MNKNQPQTVNNAKLLEEAAKKLQKIERGQKQAEKYFKDRDNNENKLKLLEANLKKKVKLDKRISMGLEEKTVDKIQILLKNLANIDSQFLLRLDNKNIEKVNESVQTDQEEIQSLKDKFNNLEKENDINISKKNKYKNQIELLKSEIDNLKTFNEKILKENKLLTQNLEDLNQYKSVLDSKLIDLQTTNDKMNDNLKKNENEIKEFLELKNIMEDKLEVERAEIELEEEKKNNIMDMYRGNIKILLYMDLFDNVTSFLPSDDIINMKLTCKPFFRFLENNPNSIKHLSKSLVLSLRKKVIELNAYDMRKDYLVSDDDIEKLIKDYVKSQKLPGKELKNSIIKSLNFLNKDVKVPLGIKPSTVTNTKCNNSGSATPGGQSGILGGFGSLIGGMFKVGANVNPQISNQILHSPLDKKSPYNQSGIIATPLTGGSKGSSRGMSIAISGETSIEIEKYDKFLILENLHTLNDHYEFEYLKPEDIKNILNKFLKSNFSTEKLTAFIKEVCLGYSELLYYSNKSIIEIRELEIVKNALNERFRRFHKLSNQLENELNELKKSIPSKNSVEIKSINDLNNCPNDRVDEKYSSLILENNKLKEQQEINLKKLEMLKIKEDQVFSEYESFKIIYLKEIRNLKFDLDETIRQRDVLRDVLVEFKTYFNTIIYQNQIK